MLLTQTDKTAYKIVLAQYIYCRLRFDRTCRLMLCIISLSLSDWPANTGVFLALIDWQR